MFVEKYESGIKGNFIIIENEEIINVGYKSRMIIENRIPSFLECSVNYTDGRERYVYDITSCTNIYDMFEHEEMGRAFLCSMINSMASVLENANEYLLPCEHLMFDPKHIYTDRGSGRILWCYYPGSYTGMDDGMNSLAEYILEKADHKDKETVTLAYDLYKQVVGGDYTLRKLIAGSEELTDEVSDERVNDDFVIDEDDEFYLPEEDDEPKMPLSGKIISLVCMGVLLIISGTVLAAMIYRNDRLLSLFAMKEMQVFTGLTGAVTILLPVLIFIKWLNKVRSFRRRLKEAVEDKDDLCLRLSEPEYHGETGRLDVRSVDEEDRQEGISHTVKLFDNADVVDDGILHRLVSLTREGVSELRIDRLPYLIGKKRNVCSGIINSDAVSRIHAKLIFEDGAYYMSDLNSTNGTFVNGIRIKANERIRICENDEIRFGHEMFYFQ